MHLNGRDKTRDIKCFAVTSTHGCSRRLHSIHLLSNRDLSYTNQDKNLSFATGLLLIKKGKKQPIPLQIDQPFPSSLCILFACSKCYKMSLS